MMVDNTNQVSNQTSNIIISSTASEKDLTPLNTNGTSTTSTIASTVNDGNVTMEGICSTAPPPVSTMKHNGNNINKNNKNRNNDTDKNSDIEKDINDNDDDKGGKDNKIQNDDTDDDLEKVQNNNDNDTITKMDIQVDSMIEVLPRTWPGINKLGGVAR